MGGGGGGGGGYIVLFQPDAQTVIGLNMLNPFEAKQELFPGTISRLPSEFCSPFRSG